MGHVPTWQRMMSWLTLSYCVLRCFERGMVNKLHTSYYIYSIYTAYIQHIYSIYIQHIYSIYTAYIQHIYSIYTAYIQHIYSIYTAYIKIGSLYTLFCLCSLSRTNVEILMISPSFTCPAVTAISRSLSLSIGADRN